MPDTPERKRIPSAPISRREFVLGCGVVAALTARDSQAQPPATAERQYQIGVCDWMILKRQKLSAFQRTREIGADGLEVDMGSLGNRDTFESALSDAATREKFLEAAEELGISICSMAMSGFYAQSFAERATVMRMVGDCISTMQNMDVRLAFLPLGVKSDLIKFPELRPAVVERLKLVGKLAKDAGVVIGIETSLDAKQEVALLDDIDSAAIRSYFNFANPLQAGRDLVSEIKTLGPDRICQFHCTDEDGVLLQDNQRLDMIAVKQALDELNWQGWLVIERSRDANNARDVIGNYGANTRYLKSIFQATRG